MGAAKKFEDLEVWIAAKDFCVSIYKITENEKLKKDFGLKDQIRRASISIISNISEGFERNGNKEFIQFLSYSKGSAGEVRAQLYIIKELEFITDKEFRELNDKITQISKMLSGFINYLKQSELKGTKYKIEQ
ncbi:MAG: four helix bundle protein [Bacteroidota bacterium]|nr:four helix bundle protein [Bacteroidota bacterium]